MSHISKIIQEHRPDLLKSYEPAYKHLHSHPELSCQEEKTAEYICKHLEKFPEYTVHPKIGGHGVAAVFANGKGPCVLLRADIDALPVEERTDLPWASKQRQRDTDGVKKPVMHACGHDIHITSLLAAADLLRSAKAEWRGTLILCFQPAEERGSGAEAMVKDGLYDKVPHPDIVLGGHVMPHRAGFIATRPGLVGSAADSFNIKMHGRGSHGSQPHRAKDPVIMGASTVMRLQTIASREVSPLEPVSVTCGSFQAGDAENIIPEFAILKINIRTYSPKSRQRVLKSMHRIVKAEAEASGAPQAPTITETSKFPFLKNDEEATSKVAAAFGSHFETNDDAYTSDGPMLGGSEDCGTLATSIDKPAVYWIYGGVDPEKWDKAKEEDTIDEAISINHSAFFAPVFSPTVQVGSDAYAAAALAWLSGHQEK